MEQRLQTSAQGNLPNLALLVQSIACEQMDVRQQLQSMGEELRSVPRKDIETELRRELEEVRNRARAAENGLRNLQTEIRRLDQQSTCPVEDTGKISFVAKAQGKEHSNADSTLEALLGSPHAYSTKSVKLRRAAKGHDYQQWDVGSSATSFAWCNAPRQLDRASGGSRSLPQLV